MKTLFKQIAKNLHDMCTKVSECKCDSCILQDKEKKICPYEYIFGSMPRDWVFRGDEK